MRSARVPQTVAIWCLALLMAVAAIDKVEAIVINEIMYHSDEVDDNTFEWIELYNENLDPFDLGEYSFCNGVEFTFPRGTWLDGFQYLVVCSDVAAFESKYGNGIDVIGNYTGSLANNGERIELCNGANLSILEVRYNDRGKWPVAADGTGHTLALADAYSDIDDADNWRQSLEKDGTPGEWNGFSTEREGGGAGSQEGMDASGYITKWLTVGAYTGWGDCGLGNTILRADWLRGTSTPRQTDLVWRVNQTVNTNFGSAQSTGIAGGGTPRVRLMDLSDGGINLDAYYGGDLSNVMSYMYTYVDPRRGCRPVRSGRTPWCRPRPPRRALRRSPPG
ncbi:MAG: lamin tail domain-containing protein, partial [Planctomycetota bacterium]